MRLRAANSLSSALEPKLCDVFRPSLMLYAVGSMRLLMQSRLHSSGRGRHIRGHLRRARYHDSKPGRARHHRGRVADKRQRSHIRHKAGAGIFRPIQAYHNRLARLLRSSRFSVAEAVASARRLRRVVRCDVAANTAAVAIRRKRMHNVDAPIPAGETRQIGLRSWDTQQAFYYERSAVPARTEQATPYRVSIAVDTVFVNK